jgi:hypothetical protein
MREIERKTKKKERAKNERKEITKTEEKHRDEKRSKLKT